MASTPSQVSTALTNVAATLIAQRALVQTMVNQAQTIVAALQAIPTGNSAVITTINAYPANSTDNFQIAAKAQLANLTTEFQGLITAVNTIVNLSY